jgi:hypothetical protein
MAMTTVDETVLTRNQWNAFDPFGRIRGGTAYGYVALADGFRGAFFPF